MPTIEINTHQIIATLRMEGWVEIGGSKHAKYEHADRPGVLIIVPRHEHQSPGVARSIARLAGWP